MPNKHPIIAHGELYIEPIKKPSTPVEKNLPYEYNEAKQRLLHDLDEISLAFDESPDEFLDKKIICARLAPKFEAKSYVPDVLKTASPDKRIEIIGGRKYSFLDNTGTNTPAKLYFIRTDIIGVQQLKKVLQDGTKDSEKRWNDQIRSISTLDLLDPLEKIMGFSEEWQRGTVEIVLHPMREESDEMINRFYNLSGINVENTKVGRYEDGLTFISAKCSFEEIDRIARFNPLRAIHPLGHIDITPIRSVPGVTAPQIAPSKKKSKISVGVFDGGSDDSLPLLNGYVNSIECVPTPEEANLVSHGSGVCGAILHGNLAGLGKDAILPPPCVSINSYRVLPLIDQDDFELYEAIDAIESIVPSQSKTKLYNISFGPPGAILDDTINRFTYALDRLTYNVPEGEENPLFGVAVGNDGDMPFIEDRRIQSPSDMVNGLGVGAYAFTSDGKKCRASYSCIGTGREGAKIKPDILEFGGSLERPFVLVGNKPGTLSASAGTSFATPLVIGKIGKMMAKSENITPHLGRTLIIHTAALENDILRTEQGNGFCLENIDDVLNCDDNNVIVLYQGTLTSTQCAKLPIFSPKINMAKGKVKISWTVTTIVEPSVHDTDAYTNNCIEDTFVPNDMVFRFTKRGFTPHNLDLTDPEKARDAAELLRTGYKRSENPITHSAKKNFDEADLRQNDFKWDTVIKKHVSMLPTSLLNPSLSLHAIGRGGCETRPIKYFAAVSISVPKYPGSLYDAILQTYQNLTPIELRNVNRVMVENK
ncbi:S8 family peptidase [Oscillospiraceae bacterium WX1]